MSDNSKETKKQVRIDLDGLNDPERREKFDEKMQKIRRDFQQKMARSWNRIKKMPRLRKKSEVS